MAADSTIPTAPGAVNLGGFTFNLGGTGFDSGAFSFINSGKVSANMAAGQEATAEAALQISAQKNTTLTYIAAGTGLFLGFVTLLYFAFRK